MKRGERGGRRGRNTLTIYFLPFLFPLTSLLAKMLGAICA
jgi:hypothetical protein